MERHSISGGGKGRIFRMQANRMASAMRRSHLLLVGEKNPFFLRGWAIAHPLTMILHHSTLLRPLLLFPVLLATHGLRAFGNREKATRTIRLLSTVRALVHSLCRGRPPVVTVDLAERPSPLHHIFNHARSPSRLFVPLLTRVVIQPTTKPVL